MASILAGTASFESAPLSEQMTLLYGTIKALVADNDKLATRLAALESKPQPPTPLPTAAPPLARTPGARRPSRRARRGAAPTSTPTTGPPASQSIRLTTSQAALEKLVVTVSLADEHAGHVIGRAGTGLRQIHDISHAKVSVSPTASTSGLRAVTIRGTAREVGDALSAIGKRVARRRIRNPRTGKKAAPPKVLSPPAPAAAPPTVTVAPPTSLPLSTSTPPTWAPRSSSASPHSPSPMAVDTRSGPSSLLPPGTPMDIGSVAPQRAHAVQTARRSGPPPRGRGCRGQ
ncbi:hypothetical protein D9619_009296 [Psilocybe cf. subviscida]|uniref:K Homology domain-containing protein n=1 Tax=Psilocybe cf. subviscida TaxID=2480587 RepID=A0A8H5FA69_9AGAR|nr:hypothetical protein D9619_009296 [Psilocybe cf. subviscida]